MALRNVDTTLVIIFDLIRIMFMPVPSLPRREAILAAALEVILEHGASSATIDEVCKRSGASIGSVYHHFGDKTGLAGSLYVQCLASFQRKFLLTLRRNDDAETGVREAVTTYLRWCLRDEPQQARYLIFGGDAARGAAPAQLRELNRDFFAAVTEWMNPHVHYGVLRELDTDLAAALWLGPAENYCRARLSKRTKVPVSSAECVLADGAWQALRARPDEGVQTSNRSGTAASANRGAPGVRRR